MDLPLLEGDYESPGIIEPQQVAAKNVDMPECAVLCFFGDVIAKAVAGCPDARQVTVLTCAAGPHPVWEIDLDGRRLAVFQPGVGAPLAAGFLDGHVVDADPHAVTTMADTLSSAGIAHVVGRTWTTDAFYRETRARRTGG